MKTRILSALVALVGLSSLHAHAALRHKDFTYNETAGLRLTRYDDTSRDLRSSLSPCIIFAFGGGFSHGDRNEARYIPFFEYFASRGYVVCTIDYTTALKDFHPAGLKDGVAAIAQAVQSATADFVTATGYILAHASEWAVDPQFIVAAGSSAGAITTLQAAQAVATGQTPLPQSFNYRAALSFAGAIMSAGQPQGLEKMCPALLFHGNCDAQVPYREATIGAMGLYGSQYLATQFRTLGRPGQFIDVDGGTHSLAVTPMEQNLPDIEAFLARTAAADSSYYWTTVTTPGYDGGEKKFTLTDYLRANLP